jgi:hypothetical protein
VTSQLGTGISKSFFYSVGPHSHSNIFVVPVRSLDPLDWVLFGGPSGPGGQGGPDRSGQPSATQIKTVRTIVPHPQRRSHMHLMENDLVLIELQVRYTTLHSMNALLSIGMSLF